MSGVTIHGKLSNEASQETEGNPVYVFLDTSKSGYEAWITPEVGDTLIVHDKDETYRYELHVALKERNFGKFNPPIRSYWFDKGYQADLIRNNVPRRPPLFIPSDTPEDYVLGKQVLNLILRERQRQEMQHGGPSHDDEHTITDWFIHISRQMGKFSYPPTRNVGNFQLKILTKIAAIAIAGMESTIRKYNLKE